MEGVTLWGVFAFMGGMVAASIFFYFLGKLFDKFVFSCMGWAIRFLRS